VTTKKIFGRGLRAGERNFSEKGGKEKQGSSSPRGGGASTGKTPKEERKGW